jgi:hypothetical protein
MKNKFDVEFASVIQAEFEANNIELMFNTRIYSIAENIHDVTMVVEQKE